MLPFANYGEERFAVAFKLRRSDARDFEEVVFVFRHRLAYSGKRLVGEYDVWRHAVFRGYRAAQHAQLFEEALGGRGGDFACALFYTFGLRFVAFADSHDERRRVFEELHRARREGKRREFAADLQISLGDEEVRHFAHLARASVFEQAVCRYFVEAGREHLRALRAAKHVDEHRDPVMFPAARLGHAVDAGEYFERLGRDFGALGVFGAVAAGGAFLGHIVLAEVVEYEGAQAAGGVAVVYHRAQLFVSGGACVLRALRDEEFRGDYVARAVEEQAV